MNSRERVQMALAHEQPDRPPVFASFVPEIEQRLRQATGIDAFDLGFALGNDMVKACAGLENSYYAGPEPEYTCPWGIRWRHIRNETGHYTEMVEHPLSGDFEKLDDYQIPDPNDPSHYEHFLRNKELYGDTKWLIGSCQISIFEASWYLRGMDQLMMDMVTDPDYVHALMDKVMQFPLRAGQKFIELGADMVWLGDDVSMQTGMMMSHQMWREYLKPRYAEIIGAFKSKRPDIKVAYHSCGNCETILEDMIEIGLDVLNPLQPLAISPFEVKKRYGDRLSLFGGLDVQMLMPRGTPEEVRAAAWRLREECGKGGGYLLAPAHHIQSDTSVENVLAFYEAGTAEVCPAGAEA